MRLETADGPAAAAGSQARRLAGAYPFGGDHWPSMGPEDAVREQLDLLRRAETAWYVPGPDGQWQWLAALAPLAFDSDVFGAAMARLAPLWHAAAWPGAMGEGAGVFVLEHALAAARQKGLECLVARVPARDYLAAQALEAAGFRLADVSVEWLLDLGGTTPPALPPGVSIEAAVAADAEPLGELAARLLCDLGSYADRFALDPALRPGCPELYRRWMANCLSGDQADGVLVLRGPGGPQGFIGLRLPHGPGPGADCGWVVLNAINDAHRGRGLYNAILGAGLNWLHGRGARRARVRTKLSQQAVIRAWSRLGARQVFADLTFHLWLD